MTDIATVFCSVESVQVVLYCGGQVTDIATVFCSVESVAGRTVLWRTGDRHCYCVLFS